MTLSLAIWVPIIAGIGVLMLGRYHDLSNDRTFIRRLALAGAVVGFLATLPLYFSFDAARAGVQFVERQSELQSGTRRPRQGHFGNLPQPGALGDA